MLTIGWLVIVVLALLLTFVAILGARDSGVGIVVVIAIAVAVWYAIIHFAPFVHVGYT